MLEQTNLTEPIADPIAEPIIEPAAEPAQPNAEPSQEPVNEPKPDLFTVKYNGKEMQLTKEEIITNAQKGMNYDHVLNERDNFKRSIDEQKRLIDALNSFGYEGSAQEIADALEAQRTQKSPEEIRAEREAREAADLEKAQLQSELEELRQFRQVKAIEADIAEIRKAYPDAPGSVEELGEDFIRIMATGLVDATTAYKIVQERKAKETITPPKPIGAVNGSTTQDKDYYTPEEVDRLTDADYDKNPKLMDIVRKSMLRWK